MRFIVDECVGPTVAEWLFSIGHDVLSIYDNLRGISDEEIIQIGNDENRIIITNDKDFGELIFKKGMKASCVILLRLKDETPTNKIKRLSVLFENYPPNQIHGFIVVNEKIIKKRNI